MKIVGSAPSSLDHILRLQDEMLEREIVLKGKFKPEIDRLTKVQADAAATLGKLKTVEQADQYAKDTKANADEVMKAAMSAQAKADALAAQVKVDTEALKAREDAVVVRERSVTDKHAQAQQALDRGAQLEAVAKQQLLNAQFSGQMLSERDEKLKRAEDDYRRREAMLNERESKLNERIETLKANI